MPMRQGLRHPNPPEIVPEGFSCCRIAAKLTPEKFRLDSMPPPLPLDFSNAAASPHGGGGGFWWWLGDRSF